MEICAESLDESRRAALLPGTVLSGLFLSCILSHSGEAERLICNTFRAVAFALSLSLSLSLFFPQIHFPILQNLPLALEHPSYRYHVTGWQMLGHSWEQRGEGERKRGNKNGNKGK